MRTTRASRCCTNPYRRSHCIVRSRTRSVQGAHAMNQEAPSGSEPTGQEPATRWLSQGFETLVASLEADPHRTGRRRLRCGDRRNRIRRRGSRCGAREDAGRQAHLRARAWERAPARIVSVPDVGTRGHVRFSTPGGPCARATRRPFRRAHRRRPQRGRRQRRRRGFADQRGGDGDAPKEVFASPTWPAAFHDAATAEHCSNSAKPSGSGSARRRR